MNSITNIVIQNALNSMTNRGYFIIVSSKKQSPMAKAYTEFSMTLEFRTKKGVETVCGAKIQENTSVFEWVEDKSWERVATMFYSGLLKLIASGDFEKNYG